MILACHEFSGCRCSSKQQSRLQRAILASRHFQQYSGRGLRKFSIGLCRVEPDQHFSPGANTGGGLQERQEQLEKSANVEEQQQTSSSIEDVGSGVDEGPTTICSTEDGIVGVTTNETTDLTPVLESAGGSSDWGAPATAGEWDDKPPRVHKNVLPVLLAAGIAILTMAAARVLNSSGNRQRVRIPAQHVTVAWQPVNKNAPQILAQAHIKERGGKPTAKNDFASSFTLNNPADQQQAGTLSSVEGPDVEQKASTASPSNFGYYSGDEEEETVATKQGDTPRDTAATSNKDQDAPSTLGAGSPVDADHNVQLPSTMESEASKTPLPKSQEPVLETAPPAVALSSVPSASSSQAVPPTMEDAPTATPTPTPALKSAPTDPVPKPAPPPPATSALLAPALPSFPSLPPFLKPPELPIQGFQAPSTQALGPSSIHTPGIAYDAPFASALAKPSPLIAALQRSPAPLAAVTVEPLTKGLDPADVQSLPPEPTFLNLRLRAQLSMKAAAAASEASQRASAFAAAASSAASRAAEAAEKAAAAATSAQLAMDVAGEEALLAAESRMTRALDAVREAEERAAAAAAQAASYQELAQTQAMLGERAAVLPAPTPAGPLQQMWDAAHSNVGAFFQGTVGPAWNQLVGRSKGRTGTF